MRYVLAALFLLLLATASRAEFVLKEFPLPAGLGPHDVAPAPDGGVWFTAQRTGDLGRLDPVTGKVELVKLGDNAAPHGVIMGADGAAWVTDGGLNAIVRVDGQSHAVKRFPLPDPKSRANLNTAAFDRDGILWFTGQDGVYGKLDPKSGAVRVWKAPRGEGPYGITATGDGIFYASLAGSYLGHIDPATGAAEAIEPLTKRAGPRRAWADSKGAIWISEWNAGNVSRWDPRSHTWQSWRLPGDKPQAYAVYVDDKDMVWLSEWSANAIVRFDPKTERFDSVPLGNAYAAVRQLNGRKGEVWGAASALDKLLLVKTE